MVEAPGAKLKLLEMAAEVAAVAAAADMAVAAVATTSTVAANNVSTSVERLKAFQEQAERVRQQIRISRGLNVEEPKKSPSPPLSITQVGMCMQGHRECSCAVRHQKTTNNIQDPFLPSAGIWGNRRQAWHQHWP